MSSVFLFYAHIVLTGVAIAAASSYFGALVGAPSPQIYPVAGRRGELAGPLALWLLSGPIALMRLVVRSFSGSRAVSFFSLAALMAALIWAFCLGVAVLELAFRLFGS